MVRLPISSMTLPRLRFGRSSLPVWGGAVALVLAAGFFVALPDWRLEQLVEASGLPRLLPLAQPPLGNTARLLLALVAGTIAGAVAWSALFLLFGPGGAFHRASSPADPARPARPSVRRADAHPDAPPRHPLTAAELGTPPPPLPAPSVPPAERGLPADLDQPLAAFDPAAIPDVPREPVRAVASIVSPPPIPEAEPEPAVEPAPAPAPDPAPAPMPRNDDPSPSIAALLDRLERGTRRPRR